MSDSKINGVTLSARNASLQDLRTVLEDQRARSLDIIAGPQTFRAEHGGITVAGAEPLMDDDGVSDPNGTYAVTRVTEEGLSEKLGIPRPYLTLMRETGRLDLWDTNVNGWLHGDGGEHGPYDKNLMLRILRGDESGTGVVRAVLSDRYGRIDNLDVLVAALGGVRDAGIAGRVTQCDLTERKMYVTLEAPQIRARARALAEGYRDPFRQAGVQRIRELAEREGLGYEPGTEPILHAGIRISNSETGDGRFKIAPHIVMQICRNGYTINADALASQHIGSRLETGIIQWSHATTRKALELVASQARDAVATFLTDEYLNRKINEWERQAGVPVTDPAQTIKLVTAQAKFPQAMADDILNCFIAGGQLTAGGVMHAVTAAAQTVSDADLAALMESEAVNVLAHAARIG